MKNSIRFEAESFNELPMRCKEMFFEKMEEYMKNGDNGYKSFNAIGFN